jgi:hypothetical protein
MFAGYEEEKVQQKLDVDRIYECIGRTTCIEETRKTIHLTHFIETSGNLLKYNADNVARNEDFTRAQFDIMIYRSLTIGKC